MKKTLVAVASVLAVSVGWVQSVTAQDKGVPVEFFTCNWQDGKGMADLEKVNKKFNKWADENDSSYSAWVLTPQFHAGVGFDVGWLGTWPDANAFGKSQDTWIAGGRKLAAEFDQVVDCSAGHQMSTSVAVNATEPPSGNGLVMFSGCTMLEGKSPADALPAHRKAGAEMKAMGSTVSSWLFYPGMGSGDVDIDYWSVYGFNNYTELGAATELYINGGGWQKVMGIMGAVSRCAAPVVFDAHLVRAGS